MLKRKSIGYEIFEQYEKMIKRRFMEIEEMPELF
jgi:hypothetical protein